MSKARAVYTGLKHSWFRLDNLRNLFCVLHRSVLNFSFGCEPCSLNAGDVCHLEGFLIFLHIIAWIGWNDHENNAEVRNRVLSFGSGSTLS